MVALAWGTHQLLQTGAGVSADEGKLIKEQSLSLQWLPHCVSRGGCRVGQAWRGLTSLAFPPVYKNEVW